LGDTPGRKWVKSGRRIINTEPGGKSNWKSAVFSTNADLFRLIHFARSSRERPSGDRILEIEEQVKHDVIAFLTNVGESIGPAARFVHKGLTSSDLLDTALALQLRKPAIYCWKDLTRLEQVLTEKSLAYKDCLMIGRTHGVMPNQSLLA
jgi:adenylosuccinate lyase